MQNSGKVRSGGISEMIRRFAVAALITLAFSVILMLIFTYAAYSMNDPGKYVRTFSYIALAMSSLACGFISSKLHTANGIFAGLISGMLFSAVCFIASLFFDDRSTVASYISIFVYIGIILLSAIGSVIGNNSRSKHKRRRR